MSREVVAVVEKVVLEPDEDRSYRRRRSRRRSRSAEQLGYSHSRHDHHHHHRQYHSDNNIHYYCQHHHHPRHHYRYRRYHSQNIDSVSETSSHSHHHQQQHHHHHHHRHRRYYSQNSDSVSEASTSCHHHHYHHHHHQHQQQQQHRYRRCHSQNSSDSASSVTSTLRRQDSVLSAASSAPRSESLHGEEEGEEMTVNLSLCGCGFLGIYHLGVAASLVKHGARFLASLDRVAGASAGALAAAILVTAPTIRHVQLSTDMLTNVARKIRKKPLGALTPGFQLTTRVSRLLDKILPPDAHELARGRLYVSLTHAKTRHNELFTDFRSRDELIAALAASCHIPVYSGLRSPTVRGEHYFDGGLTDNLVRFLDGRTITVSPFSGKQDIGPRDTLKKGTKGAYFTLHNQDLQLNFNNVLRFSHAFFPPREYVLQQYLELGHKEASRFLIREGLYEIHKPGDKKPMVYESSL